MKQLPVMGLKVLCKGVLVFILGTGWQGAKSFPKVTLLEDVEQSSPQLQSHVSSTRMQMIQRSNETPQLLKSDTNKTMTMSMNDRDVPGQTFWLKQTEMC